MVLFVLILLIGGLLLMLFFHNNAIGLYCMLLLKHVTGIPDYDENVQVIFEVYNDRIETGILANKYIIPFERIEKTEVKSRVEMIEKSKSVVGRTLAGGILAGGVGAIVGGVTGAKSKKVQENAYYIVINYTSKECQVKDLILKGDMAGGASLKKASNYINEKIGYTALKQQEENKNEL